MSLDPLTPDELHDLDGLMIRYAVQRQTAGVVLVARLIHDEAAADTPYRPADAPADFIEFAPGVWVPPSWGGVAA